MGLHAKETGAYSVGSDEWNDNIDALWSFSQELGYKAEAFAGMMGNAQHEGGMNPWRHQSDSNSGAGYGLFQYTPKSGYFYTYGPTSSYFAPLYTIGDPSGAEATDGYAQIEVIPTSGKYASSSTRISLLSPYVPDCESYTSIEDFKNCDNVVKATYLWVGFFEMPGWWQTQTDVSSNMDGRLSAAQSALDRIGSSPTPEPLDDLILWGGGADMIRRMIVERKINK